MKRRRPQPAAPKPTDPKRVRRPRGHPHGRTLLAWVEPFLAALRSHGNVRLACERANVTKSTAFRRRSTNEEFARRWEEAVADAVEGLEAVAWKMATVGFEDWEWKWNPETKQHVRLPKPAKVEPYMVFKLLQCNKPEKYVPRQALELSGADKGPVEVKAAVSVEPEVIIIPAMGADPAEVERVIEAQLEREAKRKAKHGEQQQG